MSRRLTTFAALLLIAAPLHAQQRTKIDPATRTAVVTINPFAVFAEYLTGDFERKLSPAFTLGAGGTLTGGTFDNYRALEAKARYYPSEKALQGFSVAGTVGFSSGIGQDCFTTSELTCTPNRRARPTFGTELSYQWIVGPSSRFVIVTGAGLKRLFGKSGTSDLFDVNVLPTARVNIGFAF